MVCSGNMCENRRRHVRRFRSNGYTCERIQENKTKLVEKQTDRQTNGYSKNMLYNSQERVISITMNLNHVNDLCTFKITPF